MKQKRHATILELIKDREVATQEELALLLKKEGFDVTQATVSRDIKELKLTKALGESGIYKYVQPQAPGEEHPSKHLLILSRAVISVDFAQNLAVIKTHSGMAQAAAAVLDALSLQEIVGTLAGDDTIFCVTRSEEAALQLTGRIKALL
ncbi:MAG: arginine repressor [Ruminococcaceae bacterium]|nr:arginine repressor [Oscillospiraceae bacterium]